MPIEFQTHPEKSCCRISGELRIWEAADTWQQLFPLLTAPDPLTINLQAVTACDGAGVQILCQILAFAAKGEKAITFDGASEPVIIAMQQAGLNAQAMAEADALLQAGLAPHTATCLGGED